MNSASPGTGVKRPACQSAFACSIRSFELETKFDRRDFGFEWQMELPSGGDVLDWDVTLNVHLELVKAGEDA